ncbi:MAG: ABC transporter permease [bacterium]
MQILKLAFRNAFRHRMRTALTVLAMTIAILAFGLLRTIVNAWYAGAEAASENRIITRNAISIAFTLPISYKEKIKKVDGVTTVSQGNWFGGIYISEKNFFPNFAVDAKSYLELYPEFVLPPDQKEAFLKDKRGAIVGRIQAEKYKWKIGDKITLKGTIFPGNWEFVLRGIYKGRDKKTDEGIFFFHWDYLNENLKKSAPRRADQVGIFIVGIKNHEDAAKISVEIDKLFKNSLAETITETEKAFNLSFVAMTEAIVVVIQVISFMIILIIMFVVTNTMAMTARERLGEYAILKAMGFDWKYIASVITFESLFISLLGTLFGMILILPAAHYFHKSLENFFPIFNVSAETFYLSTFFGFLVGFFAAVVPVFRASKIRIADGLRRIG